MRERIGMYATWMALALASPGAMAVNSPSPVPAKDCVAAGSAAVDGTPGSLAGLLFPPVQLEIGVPLEPTAFEDGGLAYLLYELHFQSYTDEPLALQSLEISDAARPGDPVATIAGAQLHERLRAVGAETIDEEHPLDGGKRAIAFICLAFDAAAGVPRMLGHRVVVNGVVAEGPVIGTRHAEPKVLAPPVSGAGWLADNGPGLGSHHRTGLVVVGGRAHLSRRFAIDWKQVDEQGETFHGDPRDVRAYFAYGENVFAVADAVVVSARDGLPDNTPRTAAGFKTAVPMTMENVAGNAVVLDLGDGQYAYYAHLKPGSVRVQAGDRVARGEWLGQVGNSGDARWPHLHFQVTTGPDILASEGLPFLIDRYRAKDLDGAWTSRHHAYPIGNIAVDFAPDEGAPSR